jgi:membrane associated rhomboid family serine protease
MTGEPGGDRRRDSVSPPAFNVPPATLGLVLLLVGAFALLQILPADTVPKIVFVFGFVPRRLALALDGEIPLAAALWPLVTHMLLHVDLLHLAVNVGFALAFASAVERRCGRAGLLAIFFACGIVGALFMMIPLGPPDEMLTPSIGASGGVFGLMGAALAAGLHNPRFRLKTGRVILVLFALNVAIGLLSEADLMGGYRIAWMAHAGGFLAGLAIGWGLRRREPA